MAERPSLYPVAKGDVARRLIHIADRLMACRARGEMPDVELMAVAAQEMGAGLVLAIEAEERITAAEDAAARRELRYMDAEVRLSRLLAEVEARAAEVRSLMERRDSSG